MTSYAQHLGDGRPRGANTNTVVAVLTAKRTDLDLTAARALLLDRSHRPVQTDCPGVDWQIARRLLADPRLFLYGLAEGLGERLIDITARCLLAHAVDMVAALDDLDDPSHRNHDGLNQLREAATEGTRQCQERAWRALDERHACSWPDTSNAATGAGHISALVDMADARDLLDGRCSR